MFIFMTVGPVIGPLLKIEIRIREVNGNVLRGDVHREDVDIVDWFFDTTLGIF